MRYSLVFQGFLIAAIIGIISAPVSFGCEVEEIGKAVRAWETEKAVYLSPGVMEQICSEYREAEKWVLNRQDSPGMAAVRKAGLKVIRTHLDSLRSDREVESLKTRLTKELGRSPFIWPRANRFGTIEVERTPPDALASLDESQFCPAKAFVSEPGKHIIKVKKEGYKEYKQEVDLPEGRTVQVICKLEALP